MTIGRMTCDQTRREPRGPVGSESTYGCFRARTGIWHSAWPKCVVAVARRYHAQGCPLANWEGPASSHKFYRLAQALALLQPPALALGFAILLHGRANV
jgi:hypothetical protein